MTTTWMKVLVLGAAAGFAPLTLMAQYPANGTPATGSPQTPSSPAAPAISSANPSPFATDTSTNSGGSTDTRLMQDKIFVRKAADGGFAEMQLGKLASQKASNDEVKKFGQKMVDDHSDLDAQMKPVADELGVRIPTKMNKDDQAEFDKLNALSGADFDKEYVTFMVKDHRRDLHEYFIEDAQTNDPMLKGAIDKGEKVIFGHLRMAYKLAVANGYITQPKPVGSPK